MKKALKVLLILVCILVVLVAGRWLLERYNDRTIVKLTSKTSIQETTKPDRGPAGYCQNYYDIKDDLKDKFSSAGLVAPCTDPPPQYCNVFVTKTKQVVGTVDYPEDDLYGNAVTRASKGLFTHTGPTINVYYESPYPKDEVVAAVKHFCMGN